MGKEDSKQRQLWEFLISSQVCYVVFKSTPEHWALRQILKPWTLFTLTSPLTSLDTALWSLFPLSPFTCCSSAGLRMCPTLCLTCAHKMDQMTDTHRDDNTTRVAGDAVRLSLPGGIFRIHWVMCSKQWPLIWMAPLLLHESKVVYFWHLPNYVQEGWDQSLGPISWVSLLFLQGSPPHE